MLCGQHCLNNLLQYPVFTAGDLADIAHDFDNKERRCMMEWGTDTTDAIKFLAEESGNVDASGNFSVQVLQSALSNVNNISLEPWSVKQSEGDPSECEEGFIVNRSSHWFTIRKIAGKWWDLNSTLERPVPVSSFYLTAYLGQLAAEGYSVFVARGDLSFASGTHGGASMGPAYYRESVLLQSDKRTGSGGTPNVFLEGRGRRLGGDTIPPTELCEDDELALAIRLSMQDSQQQEKPMSEQERIRAKRLAALGIK